MDTLRIHPQMLIAAKRKNLGGAIRLLTIAKNVNSYGWLSLSELKAAAYSVGVSKSSYYNWLQDAYEAGFMRYVCDKHKRELVFTASYPDIYAILEIEFYDKQAVSVPAGDLFREGWFNLVWEAWNAANFNGKVISQDTKQRLSGIPASTQRRLDRQAGIRRLRNYVITDAPADHVQGWREHSGQRGVFTIGEFVAFCIPSISVVETTSRAQPTGSRRLRRNMSVKVRSYSNAETCDDEPRRLFCENDLQAKKARGEGYRFVEHHERGFNVWRAI